MRAINNCYGIKIRYLCQNNIFNMLLDFQIDDQITKDSLNKTKS